MAWTEKIFLTRFIRVGEVYAKNYFCVPAERNNIVFYCLLNAAGR